MYFQRHTALAAIWLIVLLSSIAAAQPASAPLPAFTRCSVQPIVDTQRGVLASDGANIYVGSSNGLMRAYSARDLANKWRLELGGDFASGVLPLDGAMAVVTNPIAEGAQVPDGSVIRLIDSNTGVTSWSVKLPYSQKYFLGRLNGEIAAVNDKGRISLIELRSGRIVSQAGPFGNITAGPAFEHDRIVFGTDAKQLVVFSRSDGALQARMRSDLVPRSLAFSRKGDLIVGDERGNVQHLGLPDGESAWTFKTGAAVSSILDMDDGTILVTSLDNFVYLISDYNGNVIWKRRLSGRIIDGGSVLGDHFVVLIAGENSGYALELSTGKVRDVLSLKENGLLGGPPVVAGGNTFTFNTNVSLETWALGECTNPRIAETKEAVRRQPL